MCTLCLREEEKKKKERKEPTCHFPDSNSTVEWRVEYWDSSTQLDWSSRKEKVLETASSPWNPKGGKEKKKNKTNTKVHWCPCPVSASPGSSATHFLRPFSYSTRKLCFLQSPGPWQPWLQALFVSSRHLFCLPTKEFLRTSCCFPGWHSALARAGSLRKPQDLPSPALSLPHKYRFVLCFLNNKGHTMTFGDRSVWEIMYIQEALPFHASCLGGT